MVHISSTVADGIRYGTAIAAVMGCMLTIDVAQGESVAVSGGQLLDLNGTCTQVETLQPNIASKQLLLTDQNI